jgi:HD-GYP domain-containing protein (c-di-GMP phosphodiesterase class II)
MIAEDIIERGADAAIEALVAALDARDPLTGEHSRATGAWCARLAALLDLSREDQEAAVRCGTIHDLGKLLTPLDVLHKPGPLDEEEWVVMRAHTIDGSRILEQSSALRRYAPLVRGHHERMDGSGYPDHLRGQAIPLVARIIAVADSFHAMLCVRPYRNGRSPREALKVLQEGSGTAWDPRLVEAMTSIVMDGLTGVIFERPVAAASGSTATG